MSLLDDLQWQSRIFTGSWQPSAGGDAAVVEPATGNELGRVGLAGLEDLTASPAQAAVAQRPGGADVGAALVEDRHVRVISFTGSTSAGRCVAELAGRHLKRAHLELGGNSALIVLEDADLDQAISAAAFGSFFYQGQICMAIGRHLVHEARYPEYVRRLAAKAGGLPVGDPATEQVALGPLIDARQRDRLHQLVTSSVAAGVRLAAGGTYRDLFYRPTVLAAANPSIPAYQQGGVRAVASVTPFATLDDAALAERIPTGIAHINDQTINDEPHAPFGGVSASGTGSRFGGAAANIETFTETRWITARGDIGPYPF